MINFKKFECEICKAELPKTVVYRGQQFELFEVERPVGIPYIILESQMNQKGQKSIYILQATKEMIKIGRGHHCEVRVSDISVSRTHGFIRYDESGFVIVDNNSKFGTLIKVKNNIPVTWDKVAVQVGRSVITFILKPR